MSSFKLLLFFGHLQPGVYFEVSNLLVSYLRCQYGRKTDLSTNFVMI